MLRQRCEPATYVVFAANATYNIIPLHVLYILLTLPCPPSSLSFFVVLLRLASDEFVEARIELDEYHLVVVAKSSKESCNVSVLQIFTSTS